jgi:hypothetical protein
MEVARRNKDKCPPSRAPTGCPMVEAGAVAGRAGGAVAAPNLGSLTLGYHGMKTVLVYTGMYNYEQVHYPTFCYMLICTSQWQ